MAAFTPEEQQRLKFTWRAWARPSQLGPPGNWLTWLIMTGRGWGKNRTAGEWIRQGVYDGIRLFALVGREPSMVRNQMLEHPESGLLRLFPPHQKPEFFPSTRTVRFHTGAIAHTFSAENPDQFRGGAYQRIWYDEFASFRDWQIYDEIQFGLRVPGAEAAADHHHHAEAGATPPGHHQSAHDDAYPRHELREPRQPLADLV